MVNRRRLTRGATSDDEDEAPRPQRTRKRMRLIEEDNDDDENEEEKQQEVPELPQPAEDAKPLGEPVRLSGKGRGRKRHYDSFEFDGIQYILVSFVIFFSSIIPNLGI